MSRLLRVLIVLFWLATPAAAQVSGPPHVFVVNTVASPDEVNLNFSTIYAAALNRAGGTMTGNLLFSADNTLDIGASGATRPRDLFLGRNAAIGGTLGVTGASTFAAMAGTTLTLSNTGATAIDVEGGITAGTGNVAIVGTDGRIPAISSTYFASLSGANLTSIPETAITDGSLLARVASTETISAVWTFSAAPILNNNVALNTKNSGATTVNLASIDGSNNYLFGSANISQVNNTVLAAGSAIDFQTNSTSRANFDSAGAFNLLYAFRLQNAIAPAALANGNNNNYNPTNLSSAAYVILTADAGGSTLTGLTAQTAGTEITLCEPTPGAGSLTIASESASSTAANRFNLGSGGNITLNKDTSGGVAGPCATFWYYGTGSRWLLKSTSTSVP